MKKYLQFIKFALYSFLAWLAEFLLYSVLVFFLVDTVSVRILYYLSRVAVSVPGFVVNRHVVFNKKASAATSFYKFFILQVVIMLIAAEATHLLSDVIQIHDALAAILIRIPVDGALFITSYFCQKYWIFKK